MMAYPYDASRRNCLLIHYVPSLFLPAHPGLLQLRLYRVFELFDMLEYNMVVSQFMLVMIRNNIVSREALFPS